MIDRPHEVLLEQPQAKLPRWSAALLVAICLQSIAVIAWIGFESQSGAKFGNDGVEVSLAFVGDLKNSPEIADPEEIIEEQPFEPKPIPRPVEPPTPFLEPLPQLEEISPEPSLLSIEQPLTLPSLEVPIPQLSITTQEPTNSGSQSAQQAPGSSNQVGTNKRLSRSYLARVAAQLNRHKRYPKTSRRAREEGRVEISLTVYEDGRVDSVRVTKSSGFSELDAEALRMVERASPFPKFSSSMSRRGIRELQFRSFINFSIKD